MSPPFLKDAPEAIKAKLKGETGIGYFARDKLYNQAISEIDWSAGQVLDALKQHGVDERTIVLFSSDNGSAKLVIEGARELVVNAIGGLHCSTNRDC